MIIYHAYCNGKFSFVELLSFSVLLSQDSPELNNIINLNNSH